MAILDDLLAKFQQDQERANAANEARYQEAKAEYDKIIEQYLPGGAFGQGFEAQLERARTKSIAQGMQALVSSGLASTTEAATLGKRFEEEVGAPARQQMEDIRYERLASARAGKAGLIERREDIGPDYGLIAQLAAQASSGPSGAMEYAGPSNFQFFTTSKGTEVVGPNKQYWGDYVAWVEQAAKTNPHWQSQLDTYRKMGLA